MTVANVPFQKYFFGDYKREIYKNMKHEKNF